MKKTIAYFLLWAIIIVPLGCSPLWAQSAKFDINIATVDIGALSKTGMFNFQITSRANVVSNIILKGSIKYRNQAHSISYSLTIPIQPGINSMQEHMTKARFEYSSGSVRELLEQFDRLPSGTLQYCVWIEGVAGEVLPEKYEDCAFGKTDELFLINLIDPEDKAKIYELNPMLSWVANYPFASSLSYAIKVVEMKHGQNAVNAIKRNNAMYQEKGLMQMSINYPIYAKPLEVGNTYAWTVDAYYKDILLGGAEPWQFTIVEDSVFVEVTKDPAYVDIVKESGNYRLNAPGILKIKYLLEDSKSDTLELHLFNKNDKQIALPKEIRKISASLGDNRYELDLRTNLQLKHLNHYLLRLRNQNGKTYKIPFRYINPDFIK